MADHPRDYMIAPGDLVVYLHDGRTVDLSGRTAEQAIAYLISLNVTLGDIVRTVHRIRGLQVRRG